MRHWILIALCLAAGLFAVKVVYVMAVAMSINVLAFATTFYRMF